jgi:hypothetical protein
MGLSADNHATNPKYLIRDLPVISTSIEQLSQLPAIKPVMAEPVAAETTIYGRMQCSGTADSNLSMIAYGVS